MYKNIFKSIILICLLLSSTLFANEKLDIKQQKIVAISALSTSGDMTRLKVALQEGLEVGLSINEIKESIVHLYAYIGFPKSLNSLNLFRKTVDMRKSIGIKDKVGKESTHLEKDFNRDKFGAKIRAKLAGRKDDISGLAFQKFSPEIDMFLKEHLFADLFARDAIDYKTRELVTISALSAMDGTSSQLYFHYNGAMNMGLTQTQLKEFAIVVSKYITKNQAKIAKDTLDKVLKNKK
jgi:alkylhydroperoxidase/carboxymuconolactone decarboxylase family protein YurZ